MDIHIDAIAGHETSNLNYHNFVIIENLTRHGTRTTIGIPPILVEKDRLCEECGSIHDIEKCPLCGSFIHIGYGFMGGGLGTYYTCGFDEFTGCPWMYKILDAIEE
jgi:hypothetical protein